MKTSKGVKKIDFHYKIMPNAQKTVILFASMYVIWLKAIRNWQYFRVAIFYQFEDLLIAVFTSWSPSPNQNFKTFSHKIWDWKSWQTWNVYIWSIWRGAASDCYFHNLITFYLLACFWFRQRNHGNFFLLF